MKISRYNKFLLFEQEFLTLLLVIVLGYLFYSLKTKPLFYFITLLVGFALYFWMIFEEKVYRIGKKHSYFEHTSSYITICQVTLVLSFLFAYLFVDFLVVICMILSVIMYSIALSRIILYKAVFRR
jgi:hypothetical protein